MNRLEFRRQKLADPRRLSADGMGHAQGCPNCAAFAWSVDEGDASIEHVVHEPESLTTVNNADPETVQAALRSVGASIKASFGQVRYVRLCPLQDRGNGWQIVFDTPQGLATQGGELVCDSRRYNAVTLRYDTEIQLLRWRRTLHPILRARLAARSTFLSFAQGKGGTMRIGLAFMLAMASGYLQAQPAPDWLTLSNPRYGWSVTYPAGWKTDATNPDDVRLHASDGSAQCGIHGAAVRFETAAEYADFMIAFNEKYFGARGVKLKTSGGRPLALARER